MDRNIIRNDLYVFRIFLADEVGEDCTNDGRHSAAISNM